MFIVEAMILMEKTIYKHKVHNVISGGDPWNSVMWNSFGIINTIVSYQYLLDSERRLWFISNFPYLINIIWTRILKNKILKVEYSLYLLPIQIKSLLIQYNYIFSNLLKLMKCT